MSGKFKPLVAIRADEWTRCKLYEMVCATKNATVSSVAKQCDLNYQTVHSILSKGAEPKENTVKRIAKGRGQSLAEYYATAGEIVVTDPYEAILIKRYRNAPAERRLSVLNELVAEND